MDIVWTVPDGTGSTITGEGVMSGLTIEGDSNSGMTWSATFKSTGVVAFAAGS